MLIVLKRSLIQEDEKEGRERRAVDGRVLSWLAVKLCKPSMDYTLNELMKIVECRQLLSVLKIDIRGLVLEKLGHVRHKHCSLQDIKDVLYFLPLLEFQKINYLMEAFLKQAHPKDIL